MKALVAIILILTIVGCQKEKIIDPTGLYRVTTQEGSMTRIGTLTINKFNSEYTIVSDYNGTMQSKIINGKIDIYPQTILNKTFYGSGTVDNSGNIYIDLNVQFGILYKVKIQGSKAK